MVTSPSSRERMFFRSVADVVLLDYPNHIATAVCFNENVSGDFVTVEGKKYIVCDPTYIGASIGKAMPQFKRVAAKVLKY